MTREQIRLECLKLVNRHDHTGAEVIVRAKEFEAYIAEDVKRESLAEAGPAAKNSTVVKNKKTGNADFLT